MHQNYHAIVLGKRDYGERDRLYILYTQEKGKIVVRATGARKHGAKLSPHLETGNVVYVSIAQRHGRGVITHVFAEESWLMLRNNLSVIEDVLRACTLVERLTIEGDQDRQIFALIIMYFRALASMEKKGYSQEKIIILTEGMLFQLLAIMGYQVKLHHCAHCGVRLVQQEHYGFSLSRGGLLCNRCIQYQDFTIVRDTVVALRIFSGNSIDSLRKLTVSMAIANQLRYVTNRRIQWII